MPVYNKRGILLLPKVIVLNPKDGCVASFDIAILELLCYNNFIRLFFSKIPLLAVSEPIGVFGGNSLFFIFKSRLAITGIFLF